MPRSRRRAPVRLAVALRWLPRRWESSRCRVAGRGGGVRGSFAGGPPPSEGGAGQGSGGAVGRMGLLVREMTDRIEDASGRVARMEAAVKRGEQVMQEAVAVFQSIEHDARRTLELADAVLRASERQDALVRQVNEASTLVASAADAAWGGPREAL